MTSAERIRILRERAGLSQNDLAVKLDLSRSSISMYETGERIPSTYVYQSMADLFNVDLDYIMGRSDKITVLPERLDYENRISKNTNRVLASMRRLNDDVDDIVALKYQQLLLELDTQPVKRLTPLYPGDSAWVLECKPQRSYSVHCYDKFQHTWVIRNNGTQTWRGRKLVFANCNEVRPRADINSIDIPDTPPGKDIKITTGFDARGGEYSPYGNVN